MALLEEEEEEEQGLCLHWPDALALGLYFVIVLVVGLISSWRTKRGTVSGYFLASRNMHWIPVGASLFSSNIGVQHFIGLSGAGAASGIGFGAFELSAIYILIMLGWWFVPVYISSGVYTMPEYLRERFGGQRIRVYLSCLALFLYIFVSISSSLYSGALFIMQALGKNSIEWMYLSILILLVVAAVFTISGGLLAVIWTDFVQTVLIVVGASILMGITFYEVGGYQNLVENYFYAIPKKTLYSLDNKTNCGEPSADAMSLFKSMTPGESDLPWPGMLFGVTLSGLWYWCMDQVIVQRALSSKNLTHAKGGCVLAASLKFLPLFLMLFPGMAARVLFPDSVACVIPEECEKICGSRAGCFNLAYITLVLHLLPKGMTGLMLAVMLAALMSSLTSIFNSSATIFTIDIWTRIRHRATDVELLVVGRVFVVIMVAISVVWIPVFQNQSGSQLALYVQNIMSFLSPPICAIFILAIFWKRTNECGAFWGLMVGLVLGLTRFILQYSYTVPQCGDPTPDPRPEWIKVSVGNVNYLYFGMMLFLLVAMVTISVSCLTEPIPEKCLHRLTFWSRHSQEVRVPISEWKNQHTEQTARKRPELGTPNENADEKIIVTPDLQQTNEDNSVPKHLNASDVITEDSALPLWRRLLNSVCGVDTRNLTTTAPEVPAVSLESPEEKARRAAEFLEEKEPWSRVVNCLAFIVLIGTAFLYGFYS